MMICSSDRRMKSVFPLRPEEMESFLFDDIGSVIQNKAIERIISSMTIQLCHLLISMERKDVKSEVFASLEQMAEELAKASEEFVQVAERLAGDSEEEWLREEMKPVAGSLLLSGRNIRLVAGKLHLQPECQHHREELVATAQQIILDTTKVLLLEDAATARKMVRAAGWCLACLDALEAADDTTCLRRPFADLAAAMLHLGRLTARGPPERLGSAGRRLRGCVPALLAAARGPLRQPRNPQLAASRRHAFAVIRKTLGELLGRLQPGAAEPAAGAFPRRLRQLCGLLAASGPGALRGGRLDAPLAAVVWHCLRLAACSAPPERRRLLARCAQLLELRSAGVRRPYGTDGPLGAGTGQGVPEPGEERASLRAATEALSQGMRAGLLRQILDTFTDTHSPLRRLLQAALGSLGNGEDSWRSLQLFLAVFQDQAKQMLRVAHLVLVCCPGQPGRDIEAAVAGVRGLVLRVQQLFSYGPQGSGRRWSPAALQALLQAWVGASERLLACFDDVLYIPEFLRVSIQDMIKHSDLFTGALRSGESREFSRSVAYLQGRATHIVQVMSRYVGQNRDPIFRNGLRVLIRQLEQYAWVLGAAAEHSSGGYSSRDTDMFFTMARHLICSAQQVQEGLNGTNHPDILSPLRHQVQRLDFARGQPCFILSGFQDPTAAELKYQKIPELGEGDQGTSCPLIELLSRPLIPDTHAQKGESPLPASSKAILSVESWDRQAVASACTNVLEQDVAMDAAQEALDGEEPLGSERMTRFQEILMSAPSAIDLTKDATHRITNRSDRLLEVTRQLPERTRETKQDLVASAGDWYPLCQQLFCHNPATGLPDSMAVFMELQQNLALMVRLAAKSEPLDLDKKNPDSAWHPEVLLQMQGRLEETEIHAKQLLDKVLAFDGLQTPESWDESIEDGCLLWSVAVQDLIQSMERFSRRQSLFLLPLRQAVKDQQGLQEGLDQIADVSQRLQEAARLSCLLCGDEQVKGEVSFLCKEVHVLRDALLDVAQILVSSPRPSPSLSTRFDLLSLELTLRAKALTGHLSSINADYERAFHDAICPWLSECKNPESRTEGSLERMVSGIQDVQRIIARGRESASCQEDLLVALQSILFLTKEVAQRVPGLQEHPEEWGWHMLDWLRWEWAAKAHHAVAQLQAWEGDHTKAWRFLAQCLKHMDEPVRIPEQDPVWVQLHCEEGTAGASAEGRVDSQHMASRDSPRSSVGTCPAGPAITGTSIADTGMQQGSSPLTSPGCAAGPCAGMDQPLPEDGRADGEDRITRITHEMAKEVFLMAQSLRKRECVLTKDQLISSARKIATSGQNFTRLVCIIAKNCVDQRCSRELSCMAEQIQTMSNQLRIISSVKASLERSESSSELLVGNAQQLLQAVSKTVRAAEAASLRGLQPPSPDPEELEVAAFCMQRRRKLLRHRLQEPQTDCDELGLRKTSTEMS